MYDVLALKKSLRKALIDYKRERPNLSLRAIAKNSGVNRYFLSKILDESESSQSLDLNQVLILSKYMTQRESLTDAINDSCDEVREVLKQVFYVDSDRNSKIVPNDIQEKADINNKYIYFVLVLSTYKRGTKREYVSKIFGEKGEIALEELLYKQIVHEENGRIKLVRGNDFTVDFNLMAQRIPDYLSYFRFDRAHETYLHVISEGVSRKALKEIRSIHKAAYCQIMEVLAKEENQGDVPFFAFACMDRFLDKLE